MRYGIKPGKSSALDTHYFELSLVNTRPEKISFFCDHYFVRASFFCRWVVSYFNPISDNIYCALQFLNSGTFILGHQYHFGQLFIKFGCILSLRCNEGIVSSACLFNGLFNVKQMFVWPQFATALLSIHCAYCAHDKTNN